MIQAPHTENEETRIADVVVYYNGRRIESDEWEATLFMESSADLLTLTAPQFIDKNVRVIKKSDWLKGKKIEPVRLTCRLCNQPIAKCMGECDIDTFLDLI